jgi:hypothetical protein
MQELNITNIITDLKYEKEILNQRLFHITQTITHLQDLCPHKNTKNKSTFIYSGSDSHYDYHRCSICGKEERI